MPESKPANPLDEQPDPQAFEQAVRRGLGRAVLWLSWSRIVPDRDFILHACTHNLAHDPQFEGNRASYMFDIINAVADREYYARAIERALTKFIENEEETDDEPSLNQVFDLLGLLAKDGDTLARRSLYAFFDILTAETDRSRADVLVNIDGLEGYLHAIRQWIQYPQGEDDPWHEVSLLEDIEERFGAENVQAFLEQAALSEPAIGAYISEVQEKQADEKRQRNSVQPTPQMDIQEVRQLIADLGKRFVWPTGARVGEKLSDADAEQMAQELLAETDPQRLERYLFLFRRRPFPLDHGPLLALARGENEKVATAARAALCAIRHPSVRALALELVDNDPRPWELLEMLTHNFQEGDEKFIKRILKKPWNDEEMHSLGLALLHVFKENSAPAAADSLLLFYERGTCTWCRKSTIKLLDEFRPLPDYILDECRYDAYDSTQELIQELTQTDVPE